MTEEQFKQLIDRMNAIEAALFNLENKDKVRIALNYGVDAPIYCQHLNSEYNSAGWYCLDCGESAPVFIEYPQTGESNCKPL